MFLISALVLFSTIDIRTFRFLWFNQAFFNPFFCITNISLTFKVFTPSILLHTFLCQDTSIRIPYFHIQMLVLLYFTIHIYPKPVLNFFEIFARNKSYHGLLQNEAMPQEKCITASHHLFCLRLADSELQKNCIFLCGHAFMFLSNII